MGRSGDTLLLPAVQEVVHVESPDTMRDAGIFSIKRALPRMVSTKFLHLALSCSSYASHPELVT